MGYVLVNIRVHLDDRNGMYTVYKFDKNRVYFKTKRGYDFTNMSNVKCLAGGIHNFENKQHISIFFRFLHKYRPDMDRKLSKHLVNNAYKEQNNKKLI